MVQILREKTRQYASDQSGAIRTAQVAQNVSEWNQVIQGVGNIAGNIMERNERAEAAEAKKAEQADQTMIKTQMGQQANITATDKINKEISAGTLDPNSDAGKARIEKAFEEAYAPYLSKVQTESGRVSIQELQRSAADKGLLSARKAFEAQQKNSAMSAMEYVDLYNSKVAEDAGKMGDIESFQNFTDTTVEPVVEYMVAHGKDKDKNKAEANWRLRQGTNYIIGMAQADPVEAARILNIQDRSAIESLLKEDNPKMSKKEIQKLTDSIFSSEQEASKEKLKKIFGDKVLDLIASQEKDAPVSEDEAVAMLQRDLTRAVGRIVEKGIKQQQLSVEQDKYNNEVSTVANVLSPNPIVSANASLQLETADLGESKQFADEVKLPELKLSLNKFQENSVAVKEEKQPTTEGTLSITDSVRSFAMDNNSTYAQKIVMALNSMNDIHEAPVTQEQYEQANNIMFNAIADSDYAKQLTETMASASILDHYSELFSVDLPETEKELQKPESTTYIASGLMKDWKSKKFVDFNYAAASEKNKAKYNLVKDTFVGVNSDISNGDFDSAKKKIFQLPYNVAFINYEGKLSKDDINRFMERDLQGNDSVYPEFQYNGYTFQYLGIDQTGTILAKRRL